VDYYDDFKSERFRNAQAIGRYADALFRGECKKRGLNPETATLAAIAAEPIPTAGTMTEDDILNLWSGGLSRPEIIALGCNYCDFLNAIRKARAVGDPRAYYRFGRSRLPWKIQEPKDTRPKRSVPKAPQMSADAFSPQAAARRQSMEKKPPHPPAASSVGPAFVGKVVDDLVAVLPQIDEAKRQLDRRFVPKSDILRAEVVNKD